MSEDLLVEIRMIDYAQSGFGWRLAKFWCGDGLSTLTMKHYLSFLLEVESSNIYINIA